MASTPAASAGREDELARLIEAQARDDASRHQIGGSIIVNEASYGAGHPESRPFEAIADPRAVDPSAAAESNELLDLGDPLEGARRRAGRLTGRLVGLSVPWMAAELLYRGRGPCPACGEAPPPGSFCLVCSASSEDPTRHPMKPEPRRRPPPPRKAGPRRRATGEGRRAVGGPDGLAGGLGPAPADRRPGAA